MDKGVRSAASGLNEAAAARAPIAFEAVRDALSASYCLLFAERVTDRQVECPQVDGVDRAYGERLQTAAVQRLLPPWLCNLDEGIVVDRAALARDGDFARSDFYNYVIRPEGRFHCLIATPHVTPARRYHLIVGRPARYEEFTPVEVLILHALLPHVAHSIVAGNDVAYATRQSRGLMAAFDSLSDAVAVVRATGELDFANAGARRLLALGDGLGVVGAKLRAVNAAAAATLHRAVAQVTAGHGSDKVTVACPRPSGLPPYLVTVRRIDPAPYRTQAGGNRALLLIVQPPEAPRLDLRSLAREYGLTGRELELAVLLAEGGTLRHAAATMDVGYETARSHLRGLFSKMDVHRQSDMVRKLLRG